jgi:hypothetical protein
MSPSQIRSAYVLYIGAGAVAAGGIISLFRSLPTIWHGLKGGISDFRGGREQAARAPRTDQDLSMKIVVGGIFVLLAMIMIFPQLNLQWNILGAILIVAFGFLFVTVSSRLTGEIGSSSNPISGMTVATLLLTCLIFLIVGWTGPTYYVTALSIGGIVCIAASNGGTTSQDLKTGFLVGSTPKHQQTAILIGALASAVVLGPILLKLNNSSTIYFPSTSFEAMETPVFLNDAASSLPTYSGQAQPTTPGSYRLLKNEAGSATEVSTLDPGEYLVDQSGKAVFKVQHNFPEGLTANTPSLGPAEKLEGKQGEADSNTYRTWQKTDDAGGPPGKYLVNEQGTVVYLADPGINGTHKIRPDGTTVTKFDAPKAVLMSYIIKGILNHKLPWGLVLLGVMIAIVLEMSGIPSLAFAVGVYLPLSSSSPIFIGGMIRWLVDKYIAKKFKDKNLTEEQLVAEGDKSAGVLMASGYIAGGALAGIIVAFIAGYPPLGEFNASIEKWAGAHNPFFNGPSADMLSLIPFVILMILLYLAGREAILAGRSKSSSS